MGGRELRRVFILPLLFTVLSFLPISEAAPVKSTPRNSSASPTLIELSGGETAQEWAAAVHAVRNKDLDVVGIVLPTPDPGASSVRAAEKLKSLLNRPDIPVLPAARPDVNGEIFALWVDSTTGESTTKGELGDEVLSLVAAESGSLQVLSTGKLEGLTAAWRKDPKVACKLRRILLSGATVDNGVLAGFDGVEGQTGSLLLSATCPIVIFPRHLNQTLAFDFEHLKDLSEGRTPLSDNLTRLFSLEASRSSSGWESGIPMQHAAMVAYGFEKDAVELERTTLAMGSSVGTQIEVLLAQTYHADAILAKWTADVTEPMVDFSMGFSHYLFNLSRLAGTTKLAISERLKTIPPPKPYEEAGSVRENRIRQILDYLEATLDCFSGVTGDPAAEAARSILIDAYRKVGSIGWRFPPDFYSRWTAASDRDGRFKLDVGVSNPHARLLKSIEVEAFQGEEILASASLESTTGEATFALEGKADLGNLKSTDSEQPSLKLHLRLECAGTPDSAVLEIPIQVAP